MTVQPRFVPSPIRHPLQRPSDDQDMSIRSMHRTTEFYAEADIPRQLLTSANYLVSIQQVP